MQSKSRISTKNIVLCALMAAFTAVCAQIQISLPVIPITLGLFGVFMTACLLGPLYGTLSVTIYVLIGAIGVPVFAGFKGGIAVLFGSTGGYIIGYIFAALIIGLITRKFGVKIPVLILAMAAGTLVCYFFGTVWYMVLSGNSLAIALTYCVLPFIPGECIKIIVTALLVPKLKKAIENM
ncbi:MAG: biotin transporter BioY [Lachnospiraceae bacterium]|nr:biotin transporter BioY [Lachnospiraceae bacterium]